jgi:hypothetical protein
MNRHELFNGGKGPLPGGQQEHQDHLSVRVTRSRPGQGRVDPDRLHRDRARCR